MTDNQLYILDARKLENEKVFGYWYNKMPPQRREKIDRFRFEKDKRLSLGAGILLYTALSREEVKKISIRCGEYGKPYLTDNKDVFFNISHSGSVAVCAVSSRPVGVDVEELRHFDERLKSYVYSADELGKDRSDSRCTRLWTIKESVMKYFGTGISLGAKKIHISFGDAISVSCDGFDTAGLFISEYAYMTAAISVCSEFANFDVAPEFIDPASEQCRQVKRV
ncbi:MAG: 4'-phosphopantetheinyl transferase superfamily protein [Clostridia bacterium]|nr:4'-phosphopantetheinyl transferase superfamily protein [Clostridia bacterium]